MGGALRTVSAVPQAQACTEQQGFNAASCHDQVLAEDDQPRQAAMHPYKPYLMMSETLCRAASQAG